MDIQVKLTEKIEINTIQHLLNNEMLGRICNKRYEKLFIAYEQSNIVGIGVVWLNNMHPYAQYAAIFSDDNGQANIIEDSLFEEMKRSKGEYERIIYSFWHTDERMLKFTQRQSLQLLRQTFMPKLKIIEIIRELEEIPELRLDQIYTLREILNEPPLKQDFLHFLKATYEETHLVNPSAKLTIAEWEQLLTDEEPLVEESLVHVQVLDGKNVVKAYILLHHLDVFEIGWIAGQDDWLLKSMLKQQLLLLHKKSASNIELEIDTTDKYAMELFNFINVESLPCKTWLTYAYEQ